MDKFFKNFNRDLDSTFKLINTTANRDWDKFAKDLFTNPTAPKISNLQKTDNGYQLQVLVPGFEKSELSISAEGSYIVVRGKKEKNETYGDLIKSDLYQNVLVGNIDVENIEASLMNGILFINIPIKDKKNNIIIS